MAGHGGMVTVVQGRMGTPSLLCMHTFLPTYLPALFSRILAAIVMPRLLICQTMCLCLAGMAFSLVFSPTERILQVDQRACLSL